jgi:hypothetical protein
MVSSSSLLHVYGGAHSKLAFRSGLKHCIGMPRIVNFWSSVFLVCLAFLERHLFIIHFAWASVSRRDVVLCDIKRYHLHISEAFGSGRRAAWRFLYRTA